MSLNDQTTLQRPLSALALTGLSPKAVSDAIRPKRYTQVYRVNPAGGSGVYTTINAALSQAHTDNNADVAFAQTSPDYRRLVLVDPGTYNESVGNGSGIFDSFVDVIGTGKDANGSPDPSQVVVYWDADGVAGHAVLNTSFGSHYIANMTFIQSKDVVQNGYDGHYDAGSSYRTVLIDGCVFKQPGTNSNNLIQATHSDGVTILWNNCQFLGQPDNAQQLIQLGSSGSNRKVPSAFVFLNCHASGGYYYWGTSSNEVNCINFNQGSSSTSTVRGDVQAWIGGTIDHYAGAHAGVAVEHPIHILNSNYNNVHYVVDPSVQNVYADNWATVSRADSLGSGLSLPRDGFDRRTLDYYYPSRVGVANQIAPPAPDAVSAAPTANRMYYVWVPVSAMHKLDGVVLAVTAASGNVGAGLYANNGGKPSNHLGRSIAPVTATAGAQLINNLDAHPNMVYPGQGGVWVGFIADNSTVTVAMSNLLSTMTTCYYEDVAPGWTTPPTTPNPVAVPAGTAVPIPRLNAI